MGDAHVKTDVKDCLTTKRTSRTVETNGRRGPLETKGRQGPLVARGVEWGLKSDSRFVIPDLGNDVKKMKRLKVRTTATRRL